MTEYSRDDERNAYGKRSSISNDSSVTVKSQQNLVRKIQSFGSRAITTVSPVFTILDDT